MNKNFWIVSGLSFLLLAGCATSLPRPETPGQGAGDPEAVTLLGQCLEAHGGDLRDSMAEVRMGITGEWGTLIRKIQPLVTDAGFRIESDERYWIREGRSLVEWRGPEGTKRINWDRPEIEVSYNGKVSGDPDILASSAMTAEAFALFHLGPSYLAWNGGRPVRLADETVDGRLCHRLYFVLEPGFGFSERDEVVAYIDAKTKRLFRVWVTLEGFNTTRGASVDVTILDYEEVSGYQMPRQFVERVRAPLGIHAHAWEATRIELVEAE